MTNRVEELLFDALAGSAVGAISAGEHGAVLGALVGAAERPVSWALGEMYNRVLSRAQQERIVSASAVAFERMHERLNAGDVFSDWITSSVDDMQSAKRFLEGVLVTVQQDYDERKAKHYGYLLANVAFEEAMGPMTAHTLLGIVAQLSYPQLQMLAMAERIEHVPREPRAPHLPPFEPELLEGDSWDADSVRYEFEGIRALVIVDLPKEKSRRIDPLSSSEWAELLDFDKDDDGSPKEMLLTLRAQVLYTLMELWRIGDDELRPLMEALWDW